MKIALVILAIALGFTSYQLYVQYKELYGYKNGRGIDNCLLDETKAKEYIKNYQKHCSSDPNKTKSVWFSEDIIRCLYINIIRRDKKDTIDGFRVYFATYTEGNTPLSANAENPIANTVLFVPTAPEGKGTNHKDLWGLINRSVEKKYLAPKFFDVPNHGELCPKICPPEE